MSKFLSQLKAPAGATHSKKRKGRGDSSGLGGTAGKGHKGQKARSGGFSKPGFEGGQMPLMRRLPKRGFSNRSFAKQCTILNLQDLKGIEANTVVDLKYLEDKKGLKIKKDGLRILGQGELDQPLTVIAHYFSSSAKEKIEKAGGKAQLVEA